MLHLAAIQAIAFVWPATGRQWTTTHCENFVTDGVLHIPEGATVIGESSFEECESLWKIIWFVDNAVLPLYASFLCSALDKLTLDKLTPTHPQPGLTQFCLLKTMHFGTAD